MRSTRVLTIVWSILGMYMLAMLFQMDAREDLLPSSKAQAVIQPALLGFLPAWPLGLLWLSATTLSVMRLHISYTICTWYGLLTI
jgi:hypothetical protein